MLTQLSFTHIVAIGALSLVGVLAYYVVQRTRHELRIRKIGGVRAPSLATNPLTGKHEFLRSYVQRKWSCQFEKSFPDM